MTWLQWKKSKFRNIYIAIKTAKIQQASRNNIVLDRKTWEMCADRWTDIWDPLEWSGTSPRMGTSSWEGPIQSSSPFLRCTSQVLFVISVGLHDNGYSEKWLLWTLANCHLMPLSLTFTSVLQSSSSSFSSSLPPLFSKSVSGVSTD